MAEFEQRLQQLQRRTRRPLGPGAVAAGLLDEFGITRQEFARQLGVTRAAVDRLLSGKNALSPDMAQRLGRVFGNGPALWINLQRNVNLWDALHMDMAPYESIQPLTAQAA